MVSPMGLTIQVRGVTKPKQLQLSCGSDSQLSWDHSFSLCWAPVAEVHPYVVVFEEVGQPCHKSKGLVSSMCRIIAATAVLDRRADVKHIGPGKV